LRTLWGVAHRKQGGGGEGTQGATRSREVAQKCANGGKGLEKVSPQIAENHGGERVMGGRRGDNRGLST